MDSEKVYFDLTNNVFIFEEDIHDSGFSSLPTAQDVNFTSQNLLMSTQNSQIEINQVEPMYNDSNNLSSIPFNDIWLSLFDQSCSNNQEQIDIAMNSLSQNFNLDENNEETIYNTDFYEQLEELSVCQIGAIDEFKHYLQNNFVVLNKDEILQKLIDLQMLLQEFVHNPEQPNETLKLPKGYKFSDKFGVYLDKNNAKLISLPRNHYQILKCKLLISMLIKSIQTDQIFSLRSIFYCIPRLFNNMKNLEDCLNFVCFNIEATRIDLNIVASPKSFVHGKLEFSYQNEIYTCTNSSVLIPNIVKEIELKNSIARFILIIEKFSVFNHLITQGISEKFDLIMITGCGYPDLRLRQFVQKLWLELQIPVFALMDGDAFGIDIALTYKFGSMNSAYQNHRLIVPEIRWIGIHSDDIKDFELQGIKFNKYEISKFRSIKKRNDVQSNLAWKNEISEIEELGIKVELESLLQYDSSFLLNCYLPYKLRYGKWI